MSLPAKRSRSFVTLLANHESRALPFLGSMCRTRARCRSSVLGQSRRSAWIAKRSKILRRWGGVADLVFSPRERAWLTSGEVASRASRFCDLWTRKEAVVKAIGGGLQVPLGSFDVLSGNFRLCAEVTVPGLGRWWLTSIDAPPGVAAACAAGAPFAARLRRAWPT